MSARPPIIYLIAGCNGAGKTTFANEFLPNEVKCLRFLNADEIARGLSPFKPSASAVKAARLLLTQVGESLHVPAADIRRRFKRSLVHLVDDYLPLATRWAVWDSRCLPAKRLAISDINTVESVRTLIGP
jgi:predicted ABC-type ATPase